MSCPTYPGQTSADRVFFLGQLGARTSDGLYRRAFLEGRSSQGGYIDLPADFASAVVTDSEPSRIAVFVMVPSALYAKFLLDVEFVMTVKFRPAARPIRSSASVSC